MDCLFCRIVAGEIPCRKVYEDEFALAFLDINPWHTGHTLVIPKRHVADALDSPEALSEIGGALHATAGLLRDRLGADGMNLLSNAGAVAGQEVFHLHVHLIPRYADNPGLGALRQSAVACDLDEVYAKIAAAPAR